MKQEERREQTIRLLLDSTKSLIVDKGCSSVTMKDIMDRSGLSKGAIFHYVKSKDELFAWVLQERLEETNRQFIGAVEQGDRTFDGPMRKITDGLAALEDAADVANKALVYLLGREDQPSVAEVLGSFYGRSVELAEQWIRTGQRHGVIPETVDAERTAELFVLLSLGLRMRTAIPAAAPGSFRAADFASFMVHILQPQPDAEERNDGR